MERRDILADNPVEKRRGYMPGVSVNPERLLFTAGMTGRQLDGTVVPGGMAAQTQRTMERLQAILQHAGANFSQVIKQVLYITDMEAHAASGRAVRGAFLGDSRPTSTALGVRRLADPAMLIEIELVVDLPDRPAGKPLLEKYNVEDHGLDFMQETLSDLTRAEQAQYIKCGERVPTTHAKIVQAAGNLHDEIRDALRGQTQNIFDHPTPFHPGNHVFYDHTGARDEVIEELVLYAQLPAFGFFFGCWVSTPAGS